MRNERYGPFVHNWVTLDGKPFDKPDKTQHFPKA
jgi:hypothetical protein